MVVDTSALLALLLHEPDAATFERLIYAAGQRRISAFSLFEARTVLVRRIGDRAVEMLNAFVAASDFSIEPFDADQAQKAYVAYRSYGKGSGHPARLNLGDCAAYALAMSHGMPLLFKGDDFSRTDVTPALRAD